MGQHVLDLGCGLGGPARLLALVFRCRVYGIDANCQRITDATALTELVHLSALVQFQCADIQALSPSPEFDIVWAQNAWLHSAQPALLASTAARALIPRGSLAFEEVFLKRMPRDSREQGLLDELSDAWRCSLLPLSEWVNAFKSSGFAIKTTEHADALFFDYFTRSTETESARERSWPKHELLGHRNALALGKAGVISYGRVVAIKESM
jgi:SAM-dependent methyltransferase